MRRASREPGSQPDGDLIRVPIQLRISVINAVEGPYFVADQAQFT